MEMAFMGLGSIFCLVSLVCNIVVLIHAFKASTGQGFMCLCIPCYSLYYMFTKFEHPKKALVIGGSLGGSIIGNVFMRLGQPSGGRGAGGFNNM
jgi:benzodiazapine receptor